MELPFNFVPKATAKAAEVMANFNALKNAVTTIEGTLSTGVSKVAAGAVGAAQIAANVVGKAQLASGYKQKKTTGNFTTEIPAGGLYSYGAVIPHGLGESPTFVHGVIVAPLEYGITFEFRIQSWDGTNFVCNVHASTAIPGVSPFVCGVYWEAVGQP